MPPRAVLSLETSAPPVAAKSVSVHRSYDTCVSKRIVLYRTVSRYIDTKSGYERISVCLTCQQRARWIRAPVGVTDHCRRIHNDTHSIRKREVRIDRYKQPMHARIYSVDTLYVRPIHTSIP